MPPHIILFVQETVYLLVEEMDVLYMLMKYIKGFQLLKLVFLFFQLLVDVPKNILVPPLELLLATFNSFSNC